MSSELYVLQRGEPANVPVICIPGAGGNVASLLHLAFALGEDRPVLAIQPPGVVDEYPPFATVERAAAASMDAIRAHHPSGQSVHLIGHSMGSWSVFELALQLHQIDINVLSVCLLDARAPACDEMDGSAGGDDSVEQFMRLMSMLASNPLACYSAWQAQGEEARSMIGLLALLHRERLAPSHLKADTLARIIATFRQTIGIRYRPRISCEIPAYLVQAKNPFLTEEQDKASRLRHEQGWRRFAPGLIAWTATGNHMTMLQPPHIGDIAACWARYTNESAR